MPLVVSRLNALQVNQLPYYPIQMIKSLTEIVEEGFFLPEKDLEKNPLRCISNQICQESAGETLRKNPLNCISNQMGGESFVGKLSRGITLNLKHYLN